jgi:hypothetical protein
MSQTSNTITEKRIAVERGAALLDERLPDWYQEVDLYRLEMSSTGYCVLAQVAPGGYLDGLESLFGRIDDGDAFIHGFDLDTFQLRNQRERDEHWFELQQEWIEAIEDRRARDGE